MLGPTAVGKSSLALEAARQHHAEIVSCDAMQVYREVDIVSDKPRLFMRAQVPHHLLDVVSVEEDFNAARYSLLAAEAIKDILGRGKKVLVCGGSGMYAMALLDGIFEGGTSDPGTRKQLELRLQNEGLSTLHQELSRVDPESAARINPHDPVRVLRALEVFMSTGVPISRRQKTREGVWGKYNIRLLGLTRPRDVLYARAGQRIDDMLGRGLVEEVKNLLGKRLTASTARMIGIPEVGGYLRGEYGLDRAIYLMKLNTRHYIKRQLTWFRKDQRLEWLGLP